MGLWQQVPNVASPLLVEDLLFFISDQGVATCLDAGSGTPYWQERIGGNHWSSPLYADGRIYFSDKAGRTTIVAATPEFTMIARNQLDGVIMASPAAVDGALFLRTDKATLPDPTGQLIRSASEPAWPSRPLPRPRELAALPSCASGGR